MYADKTSIVIFNRDITLNRIEMEFFEVMMPRRYLLFSVGSPDGLSISD